MLVRSFSSVDHDRRPGFIVIAPGQPDDVIAAATHHEFRHVLPFGIDARESIMWFEATAVAFEVRWRPDVRSWIDAVPVFQRQLQAPISTDGLAFQRFFPPTTMSASNMARRFFLSISTTSTDAVMAPCCASCGRGLLARAAKRGPTAGPTAGPTSSLTTPTGVARCRPAPISRLCWRTSPNRSQAAPVPTVPTVSSSSTPPWWQVRFVEGGDLGRWPRPWYHSAVGEAADVLNLDGWRARTLARMLTVVAVLAAPAAFGGAWLSFQAGIPGLAVFDIVAWVGLVGLATGRVPYRVRATALVLLFFVVGVVVLAVVGPNGVGHIWLTAAPMLAGLLFGRKALVACLVALEGSLVAVASLAIGRDWWPGLYGPAWWLMVGASIACIALLVGLPMLELLAGLEHSQVMAGRERDSALARERAEAAERAAFTRLFDQTPAGLLLIDQTARVARSNHAALALFGDVLHPDVRLAALLGEDGHRAAMRACAAPEDHGGALTFVGVVHGAAVDGAARTLDLRVVSLDVAGQRCALVGALDITARVAGEAELQRAHDEKVTLLQEVHHRVKNNLQIVSSMLSMQADNLQHGDAKQALVESTHRVRTMALIHQQLYAGDSFSRMNLAQYLQDLVRELCCALQPSAVVRFDVVPAELAIADALPLGLVINELVTNALKHGHSADGVCRLSIALRFIDEHLQLEVADQGQGLTTPWSELGSRSLGVRIVKALVRQLRAKLVVVVDDDAGARFRVTLPPGVGLSAADHDERGASAARVAHA